MLSPRGTAKAYMPKHLIVASTSDQAPPRYFLGYRSDWGVSEGLWTLDPWRATWFGADEAAIEIVMLASLYHGCCLESWPVNTIRASEPR